MLTDIISEKLKDNLIHLEDERMDALFEKVRKVSNHELQSVIGEKPDLIEIFKLSQEITEGLSFYAKKHPEVLDIISRKLDNYIKRASFYGITDASLSKGTQVSWWDYCRILFGVPIFVFGYATNAIPYFSSIWVFRKLKVETSFSGSIGLSIGVIFYLAWYIGWGVFLSQLAHTWWFGMSVLIVVYLSGRVTLQYMSLLKNIQQQGKLKRLFKRNRNVYESLKDEREEVMKEIVMYSEMMSKP